MILDLDKFLAGERQYWKELETVLDRLENDPVASPSFEELQRFIISISAAWRLGQTLDLRRGARHSSLSGILVARRLRRKSMRHASRAPASCPGAGSFRPFRKPFAGAFKLFGCPSPSPMAGCAFRLPGAEQSTATPGK